MDDVPSIINEKGVHSKSIAFTGGSLSDIAATVLKLGMVSIRFGNGAKLFKTHISFEGSTHELPQPVMGKAEQIQDLASIDQDRLQDLLKEVFPSLIGGIFALDFSEDRQVNDHGELITDQPYMEQLMTMFASVPAYSFREIHLECGTKKKVFGGSLDVMVGSSDNGNRPKTYIDSKRLSLYLCSLIEAKSSETRLMKTANLGATFNDDTSDLKLLNQPMVSLGAFAEKSTFSRSSVPLILIFGNRYMFRPFLYFKRYDVMLTTPRVIQHRLTQGKLNAVGLVLMYTLFQSHRPDVMRFYKTKLQNMPRTGWKKALGDSTESYDQSEITVGGLHSPVPLLGVKPYIHEPSHFSEESDEGCEEQGPNTKKAKIETSPL